MKDKKASKRPYKGPRVKSEKLYERSSLACGKTPDIRSGPCRTGPTNS